MPIPRHWLLAIGGAALIAAVAVFAAALSGPGASVHAGSQTFEPTIDPCLQSASTQNGVAALAQQPECVTATERPAKTHTPTPEPTDPPATEVPTEEPEPTDVPATNTPSGGAGAGGVTPPNTGFGDQGDSSSGLWVLLLGGALAAAGVGATAAGLRSR